MPKFVLNIHNRPMLDSLSEAKGIIQRYSVFKIERTDVTVTLESKHCFHFFFQNSPNS